MICAEGYVFELERRGYLQAGAFVPEVVLEHPEAVTQLHRDFVHAGSDVVEALTYYAHREKLRVIGREKDLEPINRRALAIAKEVATESGALLAGDICNTNVFDPADPASHKAVRAMFEEQVRLGGRCRRRLHHRRDVLVRAGSADRARRDQAGGAGRGDHARHAPGGRDARGLDRRRRLQAPRRRGRRRRRPQLHPRAGDDDAAAAADPRRGQDADGGAAGALTARRRASRRSSRCATRTGTATGEPPVSRSRSIRSPATASRSPNSAAQALALGIRYLGVCCGAGPHHIRALAEAVGKRPPASRYSADMSKHAFLGSHERIKQVQKDYADKL